MLNLHHCIKRSCKSAKFIRAFSIYNKPQPAQPSHTSPSTSSSLQNQSLDFVGTSNIKWDPVALQGFGFKLPTAINTSLPKFTCSDGTQKSDDASPDDPIDPVGSSEANDDASETETDFDEEMEEETMSTMSPKEVVGELDRFIVGQTDAKKAVALALRNRWRRKKLPAEMKDEIMPKNILMIGPTGVGKTEIARRLAKLAHAPFIKVEATKFTEVGFHGKDVDSIIKDLTEISLTMTKTNKKLRLKRVIDRNVEKRILDELCGKSQDRRIFRNFREHYRNGILDDQTITIDVPVRDAEVRKMYPKDATSAMMLQKELGIHKTAEKRKLKISECRPLLEDIETERLVNTDDVTKEAIESVQQDGIVFLDEIDKICISSERIHSADASSEGVQRDLLPLIEGSTITTKHGNVDTDYILFVASGAFHSCKPSDLLAELQGRLPIRVQLAPLTEEDLYKILTEPETNLIKQQIALLSTEDVTIEYNESATREIARVAHEVNTTVENIGARRLHTVIEKVMEDISFESNENKGKTISIDEEFVRNKVQPLLHKHDLQRYVL